MIDENTFSHVNEIMDRAVCANAIFSQLDQEHVDRIVHAVYEAAFNSRILLAKLAHDETGIGKWNDKVIKNVVASQLVYHDIKNTKTVGVISNNPEQGIIEIAQPIGPIFALIPVTNPTSTVIFKILIALKTRNPIIISPHKRAMHCSAEAARICYEAALKQDAPEDCIQWRIHSSRDETHAFMTHKKLSLVLATGGSSLVNAAYSSGTPALGVGPGNVPVYIEKSADIPFAVNQILASKTFDNGTVCASEQAVIVETSNAEEVITQFKNNKAYFLNEEEIKCLEKIAFDQDRGIMNADIIGKSAYHIAQLAGITIDTNTSVLMAPLNGIGKDYPLSSEILAPILGFYVAEDFDHAIKLCIDLNYHGGIGHTSSIFSKDKEKITEFASLMNAGRIVVNTPSSQGAVGGIFNTLHPSFTLGCGTGGKNITTDNISVRHLLNIQRIALRRPNKKLEQFNMDLYFEESLDAQAIEDEFNAVIPT